MKKRLNESVFASKSQQIFQMLADGFSVHQLHANMFANKNDQSSTLPSASAMRTWLRRQPEYQEIRLAAKEKRRPVLSGKADTAPQKSPTQASSLTSAAGAGTRDLSKEELLLVIENITVQHQHKTLLPK